MSESSVIHEIDFFRLKEESEESYPKKLSPRRNIQDVISKINPEVLKPAVASAFANNRFVGNKSYSCLQCIQTLPVYNHEYSSVNTPTSTTAVPLTIIYNGVVTVFDVSPHHADNIMKLADNVNPVSKPVVESTVVVKHESNQNPSIGGVFNKDLPLSRKKSLKRFLEKRKERQVSISPYANSQGNASLH